MKVLINTLAALLTILATALAGEGLLRLKNADQRSYHVEMWRYAKELKQPSANPEVAHWHLPSREAKLQNVLITINRLGMRGPEPDLTDRTRKRLLLLGSSIALGWGVPDEESLRGRLATALQGQAQVWNGGVGNYNTTRTVALYREHLAQLEPDVVVVLAFVNDAATLPPSVHHPLIKHSQLALLIWQAAVTFLEGEKGGLNKLVAHYQQMYAPESPGRQAMEKAFAELAALTRSRGVRVILAMVPDIHSLKPYPFAFIHQQMAAIADRHGFRFVDLLPPLVTAVDDPRTLYAIPGDPHPNGRGHALMANALLEAVQTAMATRHAVP